MYKISHHALMALALSFSALASGPEDYNQAEHHMDTSRWIYAGQENGVKPPLVVYDKNKPEHQTIEFLTSENSRFMPQDWHKISDKSEQKDSQSKAKYRECKGGVDFRRQSPVNFSRALGEARQAGEFLVKANLKFEGSESDADVFNNRHTLETKFPVPENNKLTLSHNGGSKEYKLAQFHYHTPPEHQLGDGRRARYEIHFVHENIDDPNDLLVVGVLGDFKRRAKKGDKVDCSEFKNGEKETFQSTVCHVVKNYSLVENPFEAKRVKINPYIMIPKGGESFRYLGSLTTPGCGEKVSWVVLKDMVKLDVRLAKLFRNKKFVYGKFKNNRPVQN